MVPIMPLRVVVRVLGSVSGVAGELVENYPLIKTSILGKVSVRGLEVMEVAKVVSSVLVNPTNVHETTTMGDLFKRVEVRYPVVG